MSDTDHEDAGAKRSGWILHAMRRVGLLMEQPEQCAWLLDDSSPVVSELRLHTRCAMYFRVKQDAENEPGTPSSESSNLSFHSYSDRTKNVLTQLSAKLLLPVSNVNADVLVYSFVKSADESDSRDWDVLRKPHGRVLHGVLRRLSNSCIELVEFLWTDKTRASLAVFYSYSDAHGNQWCANWLAENQTPLCNGDDSTILPIAICTVLTNSYVASDELEGAEGSTSPHSDACAHGPSLDQLSSSANAPPEREWSAVSGNESRQQLLTWEQVCMALEQSKSFRLKQCFEQRKGSGVNAHHEFWSQRFIVERVALSTIESSDLIVSFLEAAARHAGGAKCDVARKTSSDTMLSDIMMDDDIAQMTRALDAMLCVGRWSAKLVAESWQIVEENDAGVIHAIHNQASIAPEMLPPLCPQRLASGLSEPRPQFVCETCGQSFRRRHDARRHERETHSKSVLITCPDCPRTFSRDSNLRRHQLSVHEKRRQYSCSICPTQFTSRGNLERHITRLHPAGLAEHGEQ